MCKILLFSTFLCQYFSCVAQSIKYKVDKTKFYYSTEYTMYMSVILLQP